MAQDIAYGSDVVHNALMPLYTFSCACGAEWDTVVNRDVNTLGCPSCGLSAHRRSVYTFNIGGTAVVPRDEVDYSKDYKQFQEASAEVPEGTHQAAIREAKRRVSHS